MSEHVEPIEVGQLYRSRDRRDGGRIVEVVDVLGISAADLRSIESARKQYRGNTVTGSGRAVETLLTEMRQRVTKFTVRTVVQPSNPNAVGHRSRTSELTLRTAYTREGSR